jgi:hypothetical protein
MLSALEAFATQAALAPKAYRWSAKVYPEGSRLNGVSMAHHQDVAPLPEADQRELLERARDDGSPD